MIIGSKNKGDWGEFYALVYLLGIRNLYAADKDLNRIANLHFPILKIFKTEGADRNVSFELEGHSNVKIYFNDHIVRNMDSSEFLTEASELLRDIPAAQGRQFTIEHGEKFLNDIFCERLAEASTDVTDITMKVHDSFTGIEQIMGFSIKSYLGGAPTLLNASGATNFIYKVTGIDEQLMNQINSIETRTKIMDRIEQIIANNGEIIYKEPANEIFAGNLMMIDCGMENIIAEMLLYSYSTNEKNCNTIIGYLENSNPLKFPRKGFYTYKFKKFLAAKALGLDPSKEWNGIDDANGGYIVVKSDGDVVAYHLYNRDKFEEYLLNNTYFERASTTRHGYASLYKNNNEMYINLNLQIRFYDR